MPWGASDPAGIGAWFETDARPGKRTLDEQLLGLEPMLADVAGKTVLDVGCAEGLIGIECAKRGARAVKGIDIVGRHLAFGRSVRGALPCVFGYADADDYDPRKRYHVVLMLAVLHKLRRPALACARLAFAARELCVIRFPASAVEGVIVDHRSGLVPQDIGAVMAAAGFRLALRANGPRGEATWHFRR